MAGELRGKRIAVLATDGFEQSELTEPLRAPRNAGADVDVVAPKSGQIQGMPHHEKGGKVSVDRALAVAAPDEYSGLVLPGGVANSDALRTNPSAVAFVRSFFDEKKPVAAICHAPWMLVEADVVGNRTVTSWPSLKTDLANAGARWVDREVVVDTGLVTSRKPDDLPAFCRGDRALCGSRGLTSEALRAQGPLPPEPPTHPPGEPEPEFPPPIPPEPEIPPPPREPSRPTPPPVRDPAR